jgi:hypothetical protein
VRPVFKILKAKVGHRTIPVIPAIQEATGRRLVAEVSPGEKCKALPEK